jgi:DNA mismatch repair protein MutS
LHPYLLISKGWECRFSIFQGEFLVAEGTAEYVDKLLSSFSPKEVLFDRTKKKEIESIFGNKFFTYALEDWAYIPDSANERLLKHFEKPKPSKALV